MKTIVLKNVSKKYKIGKDNFFIALKSTNLSFDNGLTFITGKSGSGKSTLLNLMTGIDKPSSGEVWINNKNIAKFSNKKKSVFYNKTIGIVFQNYNLLENQTVIYNVMLPLLIAGKSKKIAHKIAKVKLEEVGIDEHLFFNECSELSGGEKQRVAIARATINDPEVLFCDEPTGALDTYNSFNVMELLKAISKKRLVIIVSHNLLLVKKYADRAIELKDGIIIKDEVIYKQEVFDHKIQRSAKTSSFWSSKFTLSNYKKRLGRNLFSSISLTIVLSLFFFATGFFNNKDNSIKEACLKQLDFGCATISEEVKTGGSGLLSLTKSIRPNLEAILANKEISENYEICVNFGAILPQNIEISYQGVSINDFSFVPVYSFKTPYVNHQLLSIGSFPKSDNLSSVIINQKAYDLLFRTLNKNPVNEMLNFDYEIETTYVNESDEYIVDKFLFHKEMKIVGVVNELSYLLTPKIYYCYSSLSEYMKESVLENLSTYFGYEITWYDRILTSDNNSIISSFSYQLFLKEYSFFDVAFSNKISSSFSLSCPSITLYESLTNFMQVAEYGLFLFLIISLLGVIVILCIVSFTSFSDDHKVCAILSSVGASRDEIEDIYVQESFINGFVSFILAVPISIAISKLVNLIIKKNLDLNELVVIPFSTFLNIKFMLPLLTLAVLIFVILFSTLIPISFSKRKPIKEELQNL